MQHNFRIENFSQNDQKRINLFLKKLFPYLNLKKCSIVGGLVIRYHLSKNGLQYPIRPFNDIDLMIEDINVISSKVSKDFLIYHYHPPKNGSFYIVLVDPILKIKVDIFDYDPSLEYPIRVEFLDYKIKIRGIEDQLAKTAFDIQRISKDNKVDPKQFQDARLLMKIANFKKADRIWKKRNYEKHPKSLLLAIKRAEKIKSEHPEWVIEKPFRRKQPYKCRNCISTDQFNITPMKQIYKVLGYVE